MPKGHPNAIGQPSEQTKRLVEALRDIEDRLAEERRKDRARASLLAFAQKHGLAASDFREAAKLLAAREVGGGPVVSAKASKVAAGRAIRSAREAKGMTMSELLAKVGAKGTGTVGLWERGAPPKSPKYRKALIRVLDLPKDVFENPPKPNGVAT
jgi:hypothetical protein